MTIVVDDPGVTPPVDDPGVTPPVEEAGVVLAGPGGTTQHTLTTAQGVVWNLSDYSRSVLTVGRRGYDAPQYSVYASESPGFDGEVFDGARASARDLIVPIYLRADDRADFLAMKRQLLAQLSPRRGLATLEIAEADGSRRHIRCYFTGRGGEGDTTRDREGRTWARLTLELRCPEPYWRGEPIHYTFSAPTVGNFFPLLPLRVASAQQIGTTTINVPGDVDAYPVWTVYGPVSGDIQLCMEPAGTGTRDLFLSSVLTAGQYLRIDTNPDKLTITDGAGTNRWGDLGNGSSLWPIPPGGVTVEVSAAGITAQSRITLDLQPRYETA